MFFPLFVYFCTKVQKYIQFDFDLTQPHMSSLVLYQASYFPPVKSNLFMLFVHIAAALPIVYFHHQLLNKFSSIWILLSTAMP